MLALAKQSDLLQRHGTPPMTKRASPSELYLHSEPISRSSSPSPHSDMHSPRLRRTRNPQLNPSPRTSSGSPPGEPPSRFPNLRTRCRPTICATQPSARSSISPSEEPNSASISPTSSAPTPCTSLRRTSRARSRPARPRSTPPPTSPSPSREARSVTIPTGAEVVSDPIDFPAAPLSNLAVTFHLDTPPAQETGHPGSRATTYYVHGDFVAAPALTDAEARRPLVSALRRRRPRRARSRHHHRPRRLHHRWPRSHHQWQRPLDRRPRRAPPGHSCHKQRRGLQSGYRRQPPAHRWPRPQRALPLRSRRHRPGRRALAHRL